MSNILVSEALRELLRANLLEERDLVEAIGLADLEELAESPGRSVCQAMVPVRRQFDPETAEMRRLQVTLVKLDAGSWEIESIAGLTDPNA